ncbi:flagellar motor switch protein FliN [Entomospira culicis]|uniref:Flagellar motor switch protein FliN n=1 Tax=Entomospira culicis TaxID=2719989 RepID=A0A968GIY5_9SPIO|nr:flagellar motor switch protein FliN [Entomospira culicis]NIZ18494.1 flagellar motor switch protein FliN [Entomospira culicis]NIZ68710.1 flagellar motor switch protein FliN [Entomospira culicis]WDI37308.1 flagellar motor switch protein FliN [Entomospira culicis]WDI38937.1 flagellar motor switch protein FliN [Entomospira culicis]
MMGDGSLSQDEINALLMGAAENHKQEELFSTETLNTIKELFSPLVDNIEVTLKTMADKNISVTLADVKSSNKADFLERFNEKIIDAVASFSGVLECNHHYLFDANEATKLTEELTGQKEHVDSEVISTSALAEFLTALSDQTTQAISEKLGQTLEATPVNVQFMDAGLARLPSDDFIFVSYTLNIESEAISLYTIIDPQLIDKLSQPKASALPKEEAYLANSHQQTGASLSGQSQANVVGYSTLNQPTPVVQGVSLPNLVSGSAPQETKNIGLLMDVMMEVTVELGRTRQPIKDILSIGEGTIIELDKLAGEPVDILVNHNRIAKGEVVVIDENFGVRITEILSGADKLTDR